MGVQARGQDNNIFTQIGLIVLVGLACKTPFSLSSSPNIIKIRECLCWRPSPGPAACGCARSSWTSIAFIAGVFPLVISTGAGAEMRQAMGTAVFFGMIGVTIFGLILPPVFYVTVMKLGFKEKAPHRRQALSVHSLLSADEIQSPDRLFDLLG